VQHALHQALPRPGLLAEELSNDERVVCARKLATPALPHELLDFADVRRSSDGTGLAGIVIFDDGTIDDPPGMALVVHLSGKIGQGVLQDGTKAPVRSLLEEAVGIQTVDGRPDHLGTPGADFEEVPSLLCHGGPGRPQLIQGCSTLVDAFGDISEDAGQLRQNLVAQDVAQAQAEGRDAKL